MVAGRKLPGDRGNRVSSALRGRHEYLIQFLELRWKSALLKARRRPPNSCGLDVCGHVLRRAAAGWAVCMAVQTRLPEEVCAGNLGGTHLSPDISNPSLTFPSLGCFQDFALDDFPSSRYQGPGRRVLVQVLGGPLGRPFSAKRRKFSGLGFLLCAVGTWITFPALCA